ncbi:DUF3152 domain-containing protein [Planosporangium sp. 12N6]|uniref:DUF3152 domain-containing protein n=1 Tax=Planosporangium spinosum TaxID=3402278 RepID=UPI003CE86B59
MRYEPGTRIPTRTPEPTGWPQPPATAEWSSAPAAGVGNGPGWPGHDDGRAWPGPDDGRGWPGPDDGRAWPGPDDGRGWPDPEDGRGWPDPEVSERPRRPRDRRSRDHRPETAAPSPAPARRGRYLLVGLVLVLVVAGLGGAVWGSGLLTSSPNRSAAQPPAGARPGPTITAAAAPDATPPSAASAPPTIVDPGAGTFTGVQSTGPVLGTAGTLRRFRVEVENGINEDPNAFAAAVDKVLGDPRSWIAAGQFRLQRVPKSSPAEFTIYLASPTTSESMCAVGGLHTDKFTSCRLTGQVIINDARWLTAIPDYGAPLEVYQAYAINHEVGHQLGHGHEACVGPGQSAPVMQQQTYGLKGCVANPWPFVNGKRYAGPPIP